MVPERCSRQQLRSPHPSQAGLALLPSGGCCGASPVSLVQADCVALVAAGQGNRWVFGSCQSWGRLAPLYLHRWRWAQSLGVCCVSLSTSR